jgi:hypothetical protein
MSITANPQGGGITIQGVQGSVNVQGDIVGRDQIIQNIIIVGRVLDFANVEGLLPQAAHPKEYHSVSEALNATFSGPSGESLAVSTALAGDILRDTLGLYAPEHAAAALPFRRLLIGAAPKLVRNLQRLNYWDIYREEIYIPAQRQLRRGAWGTVIWLRSLQALWAKYRPQDDAQYGLAEIGRLVAGGLRKKPHVNALRQFKAADGKLYETFATFVVKRGASVAVAYDPIMEVAPLESEFGKIDSEAFRLLLVGLVIDVIGLVSNSSQDVGLWTSLTDFLASGGSGRV